MNNSSFNRAQRAYDNQLPEDEDEMRRKEQAKIAAAEKAIENYEEEKWYASQKQ